jgi:hypothetical protein
VPGDGKEQYGRLAAEPFVKKESIGTTRLGRPICAVKRSKRGKMVSLGLTGSDSSGALIAVNRSARLMRPKGARRR